MVLCLQFMVHKSANHQIWTWSLRKEIFTFYICSETTSSNLKTWMEGTLFGALCKFDRQIYPLSKMTTVTIIEIIITNTSTDTTWLIPTKLGWRSQSCKTLSDSTVRFKINLFSHLQLNGCKQYHHYYWQHCLSLLFLVKPEIKWKLDDRYIFLKSLKASDAKH